MTLNDSGAVPLSKQWQVRVGNLVTNPCWCPVRPLVCGALERRHFCSLCSLLWPKEMSWMTAFFFLRRCHRLILKTFFHLHNRMSSDSLLSYYLHLRTLCGKVIPAIQKGLVRNTEQWELDIFFSPSASRKEPKQLFYCIYVFHKRMWGYIYMPANCMEMPRRRHFFGAWGCWGDPINTLFPLGCR